MGKKLENFADLVAGNRVVTKGSYHTHACSLFIMCMHLIAKSELTCLLHLHAAAQWLQLWGIRNPMNFPAVPDQRPPMWNCIVCLGWGSWQTKTSQGSHSFGFFYKVSMSCFKAGGWWVQQIVWMAALWKGWKEAAEGCFCSIFLI